MKKRILSIVLSIVMLVSLLPTTALAQATYGHTGHTCGSCSHIETDPHKTVLSTEWTAWDANANPNFKTTLPTSGNYYLTDDITISQGEWISSELTICLHGHTITITGTDNIQVYSNFTITDCTGNGKITGANITFLSGSVYVFSGTFNMYAGTITGNYAVNGGGVYLNSGTFNMYGGSITQNTANTGGGVYVAGGTFNMYGGDITDNHAGNQYGGGVYVGGGTFNMYDGSITDNYAPYYGGGVYCAGNGNFYISGSPVVTGNTTYYGKDNVYLPNGNYMVVNNVLTEGTNIGVKMAEPGVFAQPDGTYIEDLAEYVNLFTSDDTNYKPAEDDKNLSLVPVHKHHNCGVANCETDHNGSVEGNGHSEAAEWIELTQDMFSSSNSYVTVNNSYYILKAGNYYLGQDITLDKYIYVNNGTYNLCLNGHTLTGNGSNSVIATGYLANTLSICDCSNSSTGRITGGYNASGGGVCVQAGTLNLYSGTISGNTAYDYGAGVYVMSGCSFNMYGGTISDNQLKKTNGYGCGVYAGGTFNMYGGTISGNSVVQDAENRISGGGVYVASGTFTMTGGAISGNSAYWGGGVYVDSGTLNMSGGTISGNKAIDYNSSNPGVGGGVYNSVGTFNVSGSPVITGNTRNDTDANNVYCVAGINITGELTAGAQIGVNYVAAKTFTSGWDPHMSSVAEADIDEYFTADDSAVYGVRKTDGELELYLLHEHGNWAYEYADGTITATCGNSCPTDYSVIATVVVDNSNTYDGNARRPVSVNYSSDWTDAGAGTVAITGEEILVGTGSATLSIGNISIPVEFTIGKADPQASDFTVTLPTNLIYDGTAKVATVTENRGKLDPSKIIVQYAHQHRDSIDPIDAQGYAVMITLDENDYYNIPSETLLFGEPGNFVIEKKDISQSDVTIDAIPNQNYTGIAIVPPLTVKYTVSENNVIILVKDRDYTVVYGENTNIGENAGSVTIEGQGNYTGTKTVNFNIVYATLTQLQAFGSAYDENAWSNDRNGVTFDPVDGYTVSTTPGPDSSYRDSVSLFGNGSGTSVDLYVKDGKGNIYKVTVQYNYDTTAPGVEVNINDPLVWSAESKTITVSTTELISDIKSVELYVGDAKQDIPYTDGKFVVTEKKDYTVKVTDNAGNVTSKDVGEILIDKTAPVISKVEIDPTVAGDWHTSNPTVTVTATDSESGLNAAAYSFDGGINWQPSNTKAYTEDGTYTVTVWVKDAVGNIAKRNSETINVDTTAPDAITVSGKVGADDYTPDSEARADVVITLDGGEDANFDKYQYKIGDEGSWQDIVDSTYTHTHTASTVAGGVTYTFRAVDKAGNASVEVPFTVKKSFPVRFNANIDGATGTMEDTYIYQNGAVTMPACGFTKAGYSLVGWCTSADCTGECYLEGNELTNITESAGGGFDLYAKWQIDEYSVTINLNGAGAEGPADATYTVESDDITLTNPTREGYTFTGWTGTGLGEATMTVTIPTGSTGDRTYTANWTPITYDISYTLNGGEATNPATYTIESETITLTNPTREGYTFKGWSGTGLEGDTNLNVTIAAGSVGDHTYTANWTANEYTITYEGMDGAAYGENNPVKHTYDTPTAVSNPTKTGYTFAGWKVNGGEAQTALTLAGDGYTADITLTATWTANSYKVVFNANGGEGEMADQSFTYDAAQALSDNAFTREGYKFVGWSLSSGGTAVNFVDEQNVQNLTAEPDGEVTLYAVWTRDIILSGTVVAPNVPNAEKLEVVLVGLDGTKYPASVTGNASLYHYTVTVPEGEYQLIVKDTRDGGVTVTAKEDLSEDKTKETITMTMPTGNKNSIVDSTAAGDYAPIVGGIDTIAKNTEGSNVTVTLTVTHEESDDNDQEHSALMTEAGAQKSKLTFLEIGIVKKVDTNPEESITETSSTIEIVVPFDTTRKQNFKVYRFHDDNENDNVDEDEVDILTTTANADGEYIEVGTGSVTIHAKFFSLYAIGYTDVIPYYPVAHSCTSKCDVCGGCEDAACAESACKDKCRLLGMNFTDVAEGKWYTEAIEYVYHRKMMEGVGNNLFDINGTTTRAMIVTILWRLEGEPVVNYLMQFEDVPAETWYTEAVRWAASEGIVEGYSDTAFGSTDPITREQFATILWRYAKYKGYDVSVGEDTNILSYEDAFSISEYAIPAMQWACGAGLMQGDGVNLTPKADATRAQAAALFQRFCENVAEK